MDKYINIKSFRILICLSSLFFFQPGADREIKDDSKQVYADFDFEVKHFIKHFFLGLGIVCAFVRCFVCFLFVCS